MRLSARQREVIVQEVASSLGAGAAVWLFGSRVDDARRGGDIDLYIETPQPVPALDQARLAARLETRLHNHVDVVICGPTDAADRPIFNIARATGVRLDSGPQPSGS